MNNDLISRSALKQHKCVTNKFVRIGGRTNGKTLESINKAYQQGWNDAIDSIIDNAPTVTPIDEAFSTAIDKYGDNTFSVSVISSKGEKIDFKRVKRGKWIEENKPWGGFDDFVLALTCSECGESFVYHGNNPKFCPNCGADMREVDNG